MPESVSIALEIVRREGLIVIAILALGWQVYWTTSTSSEQDRLWREELAEWRSQSVERDRRSLEAASEIAQAVMRVTARLEAIEDELEKCEVSTND